MERFEGQKYGLTIVHLWQRTSRLHLWRILRKLRCEHYAMQNRNDEVTSGLIFIDISGSKLTFDSNVRKIETIIHVFALFSFERQFRSVFKNGANFFVSSRPRTHFRKWRHFFCKQPSGCRYSNMADFFFVSSWMTERTILAKIFRKRSMTEWCSLVWVIFKPGEENNEKNWEIAVYVLKMCGFKKSRFSVSRSRSYLELVYFVTAFVPSLTACFASSPGSRRRTEVWISRDERVLFFVSLEASLATFSKRSLTNEFMMLIALVEIPTSGCTCFKTR